MSNHGSKYDDSVTASVPNSIATAAFRFGHSMVQGLIEKFQVLGKEEKFFDHFLQQHNFFNDDEVTI